MANQLTNEQLAQIAERAEWAEGDILADSTVMTARDKLAREDVPRLLAEIVELKNTISGLEDELNEARGILYAEEQVISDCYASREELRREDAYDDEN